uniref:Uncharacterized protein n=1 Tax=Setaria italica TaxID=4555 RepID=K3YF05_SETIT
MLTATQLIFVIHTVVRGGNNAYGMAMSDGNAFLNINNCRIVCQKLRNLGFFFLLKFTPFIYICLLGKTLYLIYITSDYCLTIW